jgi:hypothetical protein
MPFSFAYAYALFLLRRQSSSHITFLPYSISSFTSDIGIFRKFIPLFYSVEEVVVLTVTFHLFPQRK